MNKIYPSAAEALQGVVKDGQLLAVGGFGICGIPEALIDALKGSGVKDLTCISNNAGRATSGKMPISSPSNIQPRKAATRTRLRRSGGGEPAT